MTYDQAPYGKLVVLETLDLVDVTSRAKWETAAEGQVASVGQPGVEGYMRFVNVRGQRGTFGGGVVDFTGLTFFEDGSISPCSPKLLRKSS